MQANSLTNQAQTYRHRLVVKNVERPLARQKLKEHTHKYFDPNHILFIHFYENTLTGHQYRYWQSD